MILIISVFITNKKLNSSRTSNNRLEIFKYMLASYSVLNFSDIYIYCKLDNDYLHEKKNLELYINELFNKPNIIFDRYITQQEWYNSNIFKNLDDNEIALFTQNDDHIFIGRDLNIINEGIELMKTCNNDYKALYYSHFPEINNLCRKLKCKSNGNYYCLNIPITDSIQFFNIKYLKFLLFDIVWPTKQMIRIDELIRDKRIWNNYGTNIFNYDIITLVPKEECFRHFDGYSHVNIDENICPNLKIPPFFFDKNVIIKYCNEVYDSSCVNINPLKELIIPSKTTNFTNKTDLCYTINDIPFFWKEYIKDIIICNKLNEDTLIMHRNNYYNDLKYCKHNNWWTNGIIYS